VVAGLGRVVAGALLVGGAAGGRVVVVPGAFGADLAVAAAPAAPCLAPPQVAPVPAKSTATAATAIQS
jgi:hypothetical protein